eukprot:10005700-Ditylum_brightwellii.AAC.1
MQLCQDRNTREKIRHQKIKRFDGYVSHFKASMPTIETVETHHDKAATTTCSVTSVKNTQQSTSS